MNKGLARWTWSAVTMAAMAWATTCRGQGLEIDIPVPEPGKTAVDGREAAKRKAAQRRENPPSARRATRQEPGETLPAASRAGRDASPTNKGALTREPTLAPPSGRGPRAWEGTVGDGDPAPLPTWANPAAIPLRQQERALAAPMPEPIDSQPAATHASSRRSPPNRAAASGSPSRTGLFTRGSLSVKGQAQPDKADSTSLLARRHRAALRDHAQDPLAPPSPWGSDR